MVDDNVLKICTESGKFLTLEVRTILMHVVCMYVDMQSLNNLSSFLSFCGTSCRLQWWSALKKFLELFYRMKWCMYVCMHACISAPQAYILQSTV